MELLGKIKRLYFRDKKSLIIVTDYAIETTNLVKNQIIQPAATAMLAQAN